MSHSVSSTMPGTRGHLSLVPSTHPFDTELHPHWFESSFACGGYHVAGSVPVYATAQGFTWVAGERVEVPFIEVNAAMLDHTPVVSLYAVAPNTNGTDQGGVDLSIDEAMELVEALRAAQSATVSTVEVRFRGHVTVKVTGRKEPAAVVMFPREARRLAQAIEDAVLIAAGPTTFATAGEMTDRHAYVA